jgi:ABC-type microcin C transport system permease subunit YejE
VSETRSAASERYGARVWRGFKGNPSAIWSLRVVVLLAMIALGADFIANDKPYYIVLDDEAYAPILIDYGVWLGLRKWPEPLLNADFYRLAERADAVYWPPLPYAPKRVNLRDSFAPLSASHWLGTDHLGRDVAAGMIHGTRISLSVGLVVVAIQAVIGIVLGGLAGYYGGWIDIAISRFIELMLGIPTFLRST